MTDKEIVERKPLFKQGDILYEISDGSKIEIIDIVADQYKFECGDEFPHYEFFGYIENNYSKELVNRDLNKEIQHWREHYIKVKECGFQIDLRDIEAVARHFANWQKEQMMKDAVDACVTGIRTYKEENEVDFSVMYEKGIIPYEIEQEVKVIVIKED